MKAFILIFCLSCPALAVELPPRVVPNSEAFLGWTKKPYNIDDLDFAKLKTKELQCDDKILTPLSKDQSTKKYHLYVVGGYDHAKLRGDAEACVTPAPNKVRCLRGDTAEYTIMSDIYSDNCGNKYRAFWEVAFLTKNESMGTLCSLGRTFYEKANSEFPGEIEIGDTYKVEASQFLFFTEIF